GNGALQRARATLAEQNIGAADPGPRVDETQLDDEQHALLARYVDAFERYDIDSLTTLLRADATQSMPPYDLWLRGRGDIFAWWFGPGIGCSGSRVIPTTTANGLPAFGQYKPSESGSGFDPWALQVLEIEEGRIVELTVFIGTQT